MVEVKREQLCSIQWSSRRGIDGSIDCCPACLGIDPHSLTREDKDQNGITDWDIGHQSGCWLAIAAGLVAAPPIE